MRKILSVGLAALLLAAVPAAAHHDGTEEQPTFRTERTYVKCVDGAKVQNVPALQGRYPTWNTTAPSGSVTAGGGCGHYENLLSGASDPNIYDLVWSGTFTGNLDAITVEAHNIYAGSPRALAGFFLGAALYVGGEQVFANATAEPLTVYPERSSTGLSEKILLTFRGLNFEEEHGDGEELREVMVVLRSYNEYQSAWVWDTTEVPSGLTFNPEKATGHVINVDREV